MSIEGQNVSNWPEKNINCRKSVSMSIGFSEESVVSIKFESRYFINPMLWGVEIFHGIKLHEPLKQQVAIQNEMGEIFKKSLNDLRSRPGFSWIAIESFISIWNLYDFFHISLWVQWSNAMLKRHTKYKKILHIIYKWYYVIFGLFWNGDASQL